MADKFISSQYKLIILSIAKKLFSNVFLRGISKITYLNGEKAKYFLFQNKML